MAKRNLTIPQMALKLGVCKQRVQHRLNQGHFPNSYRCECGKAFMIPESDLDLEINKKRRQHPLALKTKKRQP